MLNMEYDIFNLFKVNNLEELCFGKITLNKEQCSRINKKNLLAINHHSIEIRNLLKC